MKKKIIIIGAGIGGLAAGCRLAAAGHTVEILEQRSRSGGLAASQQIGPFTLDSGPSILTAPCLVEDLFQSAGKPLPEDLRFEPFSPAYRIFDAHQRPLDLYKEADLLLEEVKQWDANETAAFHEYIKAIAPFFSARDHIFSELPFLHPFSMLRTLPTILRIQGLRSTYSFASQYFNDPFLKAVFSLKPFLMGSDPMEVNLYTSLQMQQLDENTTHVLGGTGKLSESLEALFLELGGRLHFNAEVTEILTRNQKVTGVRMQDGGLRPADIIVSNADVTETLTRLTRPSSPGQDARRKKSAQKLSMGIFAIYLVTSRRYPDSPLAEHNVLLPQDFPALLKDIFHNGILSRQPAVFVHMPHRSGSAPLPEDHQAMMVYVPVPNMDFAVNWAKETRPLREQVLAYMEEHFLPELRASIVAERILTPQDFHKLLGTAQGAPFSLQTSPLQAAWFRPSNRSSRIRSLYLVGSGTHPGPGIAAVLSSAKIIERLVGPA